MSEGESFSIDFEGLVVGYGRHVVAGPLSGSFASGSTWFLTGPNGSGKTTLLRTLIGLHRPLDGTVVGDRVVSYVPQIDRRDAAFPVTCLEVVGTGLSLTTSRSDRSARAREALSTLALADLARRPFSTLSGGQRQRVLLARALCADADVIALDEPTSGVDKASADAIWERITQLARDGKLVLVVTHDLFRAPEYADHMLVLEDGRLRESSER